jgi:flagella basal body P-ring formation protein FlgA
LLQPADILIRLRFNHLDPKSIELVCPSLIHITRAGSAVAVDDLVQAATTKLTEERKKLNDDATVEPAQLPAPGIVAPGKREYQASILRGSLETGPVVMQVVTLVDGKPVRTVEVPFRIKRMVKALLAKRVLAAHAVLTDDDVTVGSIEAVAGAAAPLTDVQAVLGKRTTRQILQGAALTDNGVEAAPVVASGAEVTLEFVVGGIHLSTPAVTRASGGIGQTIRVFATDTKKEFMATVVDAKTVRVEESR